jgi:hypothetical protein
VGGTDDAFSKVIADDFSLAVKLHDAGEDETVKIGAERADVRGEFEREHGHGAVGEINGGAALARFFVDGGAVFNILGNICNVDLKFIVAAGQAADEDRIIKVAGGFTVNGDNGQIAEVAAAGEFLWRNDRADLLRFFEHGLRKDVADVVLADHDFHVHAEVVFIAEDFNDASARLMSGGRELDDFYFDNDIL